MPTTPEPPDRQAFEAARPVFEKRCVSCHAGSTNPKATQHFSLGSYPPGGHHSRDMGKTLRRVLGVSSPKATMPPGGPPLSDEERKVLIAWGDAFDAAHPPKAQHNHSH